MVVLRLDIIKDVYNLFDDAKYAINTLVGIFGHNYKSKNIHHFTQDKKHIIIKYNFKVFNKSFINFVNLLTTGFSEVSLSLSFLVSSFFISSHCSVIFYL